jgi:hypothetical protein
MINKFKNWLGIEGVKANIEFQEPLKKEDLCLHGKLELYTIRSQRVENIQLRLIEKYKRGKKDSLKIDEFVLGSKQIQLDFTLEEGQAKSIPFNLDFEILESSMDKLGNKNFLTKGLVSLLKKEQKVSSSYRLEVLINGTGSAIPPKFNFPIEFNKKRQA